MWRKENLRHRANNIQDLLLVTRTGIYGRGLNGNKAAYVKLECGWISLECNYQPVCALMHLVIMTVSHLEQNWSGNCDLRCSARISTKYTELKRNSCCKNWLLEANMKWKTQSLSFYKRQRPIDVTLQCNWHFSLIICLCVLVQPFLLTVTAGVDSTAKMGQGKN